MKSLILLVLLLSCKSKENKPSAKIYKYSEECLNGVVYYRVREGFGLAVSPKINQDSKVETCEY